MATGSLQGDPNLSLVGALAADAMADAIVRAATQATSSEGVPAARDLKR
jgi:L-aminopeptidase/D-esterase-like protein